MNSIKNIILFLIGGVIFSACESVLDKENLEGINPDLVWGTEAGAYAYLNEIYVELMPDFSVGHGRNTDEAVYNSLPSFLSGTATIDTWYYWPYETIRKINVLLEDIDGGTLEAELVEELKGQAYFWRAWAYFHMVVRYGGVPLLLEVQEQTMDDDELYLPRNKTSECMVQIISDLDKAISLLPTKFTASELGRIDQIAAKAFKGRVLLYYASPQFNPESDQSRWQNAYDINKAALEFCIEQGKGLYNDYENIWYTNNNSEFVMVKYYNDPEVVYSIDGTRPQTWSSAVGVDYPTLDLVDAFPMKDGTKFNNSNGYQKYWKNRDDRFYATIGYNGCHYPCPEAIEEGTYLWTWRNEQEGSVIGTLSSPTFFYRMKAMDWEVDQSGLNRATVPWIEIRFAEVLMNYGEAANEIGNIDEALNVLYQIRERVGILPGTNGRYGITASTQEEIREAYMDERCVEFAFENKRFWDLRRLRKLDILNNMKYHHGLKIIAEYPGPRAMEDIDEIYDKFTYEPYEIILEAQINVKDNYYFFGIPKDILDRNSKIEQTEGWNSGTFNPLD